MASTSKGKEVSSEPMEDSSIAEMKTEHDDAMQEDPERYKADKAWDLALILEKLRDTECSLLHDTRFFDSNTLLHVAASSGHDQIVEAILSKQQCEEILTAKNSSGDLPLHVAVNAGHLPIVQLLLASSDQCQELLMAKNSSGDLPLHVAVNAGHLSIVQQLLMSSDQCEELLTAENSSGDLPLHVAVNAGQLPIVQLLLMSSDQCEELLTAENSSGDLPLHVTVNAGHLPMVQVLVESAQNYNVYVVCKLLEEKNKEGLTPLLLALIRKDQRNLEDNFTKVVEFLINTGYKSKRERLVRDSQLCLHLSDAEMRKCAIKPDLERGFQKSKDKVTSMDPRLYEAVKSKNIDFIKNKAEDTEHPALSDKTPELNTILHLAAASSDNRQFVQEILEIELCRKFVTEKNSNGDLPLHVAASAGNKQMVELLAASVPLIKEKNMEGNTPLHLALIKKFQVGPNLALKAEYNEVAKFLVKKCPEVSFYPNGECNCPLYLAGRRR